MSKWKTIAAGAVALATAVSVATIATQSSANANEVTNPTFISGPFNGSYSSNASALYAAGPISVSPLPNASCGPEQSQNKSVLTAQVGSLASLTGLSAQCRYGYAESDVATANLLGGRIKAKLMRSICSYNGETGDATVGSTWGSLVFDQNYSKNGSGAIVIPNLATVVVNQKGINEFGKAYSNMLVVSLFNSKQVIVVGHCELNAYSNT